MRVCIHSVHVKSITIAMWCCIIMHSKKCMKAYLICLITRVTTRLSFFLARKYTLLCKSTAPHPVEEIELPIYYDYILCNSLWIKILILWKNISCQIATNRKKVPAKGFMSNCNTSNKKDAPGKIISICWKLHGSLQFQAWKNRSMSLFWGHWLLKNALQSHALALEHFCETSVDILKRYILQNFPSIDVSCHFNEMSTVLLESFVCNDKLNVIEKTFFGQLMWIRAKNHCCSMSGSLSWKNHFSEEM